MSHKNENIMPFQICMIFVGVCGTWMAIQIFTYALCTHPCSVYIL